MKRRPERIEGVVKSIIQKLESNPNPTSEKIIAAWSEVVGKKGRAHSKPASLRRQRLIVNVDGSTWLYELTLNKERLLKGIKKKLGEDKVKEIQFRIGEI